MISTSRFALPVALAVFVQPIASQDAQATQEKQIPSGLQVLLNEMSSALIKADQKALDQMCDVDAMLDRAINHIEDEASNKKGFRRGVKRNFSFGRTLLRQTQGARLKRLRTHQVDNEWRSVYRRITRRGAVGYIEYVFAPQGKRWVVVDMYAFQQGELNSETLRRFYQMGRAATRNMDPEFLAGIRRMKKMLDLWKRGRHDTAIQHYFKLPKNMQKMKSQLLIRLRAAQALGGKPYRDALRDFEREIPKGDPARALVLIDYYTQEQEWDGARQCLRDLDERTGGDPYLKILESGLWLKRDKPKKALAVAAEAVELEPTLLHAHVARVRMALVAKDHDHAAVALSQMQKHFRPRLSALRSLPGYKSFAASEQGQQWEQRQRAASPNR